MNDIRVVLIAWLNDFHGCWVGVR